MSDADVTQGKDVQRPKAYTFNDFIEDAVAGICSTLIGCLYAMIIAAAALYWLPTDWVSHSELRSIYRHCGFGLALFGTCVITPYAFRQLKGLNKPEQEQSRLNQLLSMLLITPSIFIILSGILALFGFMAVVFAVFLAPELLKDLNLHKDKLISLETYGYLLAASAAAMAVSVTMRRMDLARQQHQEAMDRQLEALELQRQNIDVRKKTSDDKLRQDMLAADLSHTKEALLHAQKLLSALAILRHSSTSLVETEACINEWHYTKREIVDLYAEFVEMSRQPQAVLFKDKCTSAIDEFSTHIAAFGPPPWTTNARTILTARANNCYELLGEEVVRNRNKLNQAIRDDMSN
ncbi:MAG: hypothetical protein Alpg2KO_14470 [Alphaproteobacteria bacterium]